MQIVESEESISPTDSILKKNFLQSLNFSYQFKNNSEIIDISINTLIDLFVPK
jgi:hypothetical protein